MKTILFVIPDFHYCRINSQVVLLASRLAPSCRVRILAVSSRGPMNNVLVKHGCRVETLDALSAFDLGAVMRMRRLLASDPPDAIHAWGTRPLRLLQPAGALSRFPVILNNPPMFRKRAGLSWFWHRRLINRCRRVIAASPLELLRLTHGGIDAGRIEVVANAVDCEPAAPERLGSAQPSWDGRADRPYLLCVGPLVEHKGFLDAVWAYDILRRSCGNLCLTIVGDGPDLKRLRRFVQRLNIEDRVSFAGCCPNIVPLIEKAEAVWVPSRRCGGRQAALLAMAHGTSVVSTDIPELAEIVQNGKNGRCLPAGKPVELAKQTADLLASPSERNAQQAAAKEYVQANHDPAMVTRRFIQLYQSAAA